MLEDYQDKILSKALKRKKVIRALEEVVLRLEQRFPFYPVKLNTSHDDYSTVCVEVFMVAEYDEPFLKSFIYEDLQNTKGLGSISLLAMVKNYETTKKHYPEMSDVMKCHFDKDSILRIVQENPEYWIEGEIVALRRISQLEKKEKKMLEALKEECSLCFSEHNGCKWEVCKTREFTKREYNTKV
jgi:hypothetical protein